MILAQFLKELLKEFDEVLRYGSINEQPGELLNKDQAQSEASSFMGRKIFAQLIKDIKITFSERKDESQTMMTNLLTKKFLGSVTNAIDAAKQNREQILKEYFSEQTQETLNKILSEASIKLAREFDKENSSSGIREYTKIENKFAKNRQVLKSIGRIYDVIDEMGLNVGKILNNSNPEAKNIFNMLSELAKERKATLVKEALSYPKGDVNKRLSWVKKVSFSKNSRERA